MTTTPHCPACHASWSNGLTCRDHFDQMLAWEFENPGGAGAVHHLTVLCYNLQHPSVYSPEALSVAQALLAQFVEQGLSPQEARARFASENRPAKITGTPETQGQYAHPVEWTTIIGDVAAGGLDGYCARVTAWAASVLADLRASGNFPLP